MNDTNLLDRYHSHCQRGQSVSRVTGAAPQASPFSVPLGRHHPTRATLGMTLLPMTTSHCAPVHSRDCQSAPKCCACSLTALHPSKHIEGKTCMCRYGCVPHTTDGCQCYLPAVLPCLETMLASFFKKASLQCDTLVAGYGLSCVSIVFRAADAAEFQPTIRSF